MSLLDEILPAPDAPTWPAELGDHVSASSLSQFATCPEAYRRRRLLHEREPSNPNLVLGTADSYAAATNYRQKIDTHEDLPLRDVQDAFAAGFDDACDDDRGVEWGDTSPGDVLDEGVRLASAYHKQIAPKRQPLTVEEEFTVDLGLGVPVLGYLDLTERGITVERKTASRKSTSVQPQWRVQGLVYLLAKNQPVQWDVSVRTKTPSVYSAHTELGLMLDVAPDAAERYLRSLVGQLREMFERHGADEAWPGNISHQWACDLCLHGPKRRRDCEYWR